jgi:hypothetical protein
MSREKTHQKAIVITKNPINTSKTRFVNRKAINIPLEYCKWLRWIPTKEEILNTFYLTIKPNHHPKLINQSKAPQ